jgi:mannan endo-1,4-beta-mannosidase
LLFIQGLDFVLAEARKYGIKMILSLVNNYDSFGGRKQYVQWAREQGQTIGSDDEFFTNPVAKGIYKNHIKVSVLERVCVRAVNNSNFVSELCG